MTEPTLPEDSPEYIVTHGGHAHRDEMMGCCVLLAKFPRCPIHRRAPTQTELENPYVWVLDVGGRYEPHLHNFDHHQFPEDVENPRCSLSLILEHLDIYEQARAALPWLKATEVSDCLGPYALAKLAGTEWELLRPTASPAESFLLEEFGRRSQIRPAAYRDWLSEYMIEFGNSILTQIQNHMSRDTHFESSAQLHHLRHLEIIVIPDTPETRKAPFLGFDIWRERTAPNAAMAILPDDREKGLCFLRLNNNLEIDFRKIQTDPRIHFVHSTGYIAKSVPMSIPDALALCEALLTP